MGQDTPKNIQRNLKSCSKTKILGSYISAKIQSLDKANYLNMS